MINSFTKGFMKFWEPSIGWEFIGESFGFMLTIGVFILFLVGIICGVSKLMEK